MWTKIESQPHPNRGMTLFELLVSVTLLSIVAALSYAAFWKVQQKSQDLRCIANLRSTGFAALQYFRDRQGALFPNKFWFQYDSNMPTPGMRDYLVGFQSNKGGSYYMYDTILTCPTLKRLRPQDYPSALNRSFVANRYLLVKDPSATYNNDEANRPDLADGPRNLNRVPSLSGMWAFTDSMPLSNSNNSVPTTLHPSEAPLLPFPHHENQHVVFMDGHIEILDRNRFLNPSSVVTFWGNLNAAY